MRTRFAPSPTGDLHLGGALCAFASFWLARATAGTFVVRLEDLDPPRVVRGSAERIAADLAWLGLEADEGPTRGGLHAPYTQSECGAIYEDAVARLAAQGLVYPCDCSRAEIALAASAPHAGEEVAYPGTCRDKEPTREMKRAHALRIRAPARELSFDERGRAMLARVDVAGDFVLRRGDGVFAYQLAVSVDDARMGISDVIRGVDLLSSTARQLWLMSALGLPAPKRYVHLPLVVDAAGRRLEKRSPGAHVPALRQAGVTADEVRAVLADALGLAPPAAPLGRSLAADAIATLRPVAPPRELAVPTEWAAHAQRVASDK